MRYLITAALPYANGPLHIGHIAGAYLPADIFTRYLRLRGEEVIFICGSDEHGVAITLRAWQEKTSPQAIIDRYHPLLEESLRQLGIQMDYYGRTSHPTHHRLAQHFFLRLLEKGWLEKQEVEQFWDAQAQTFLPDRYIVGTCPHCGFEEAYGDQCEKCGALLSPSDLKNPRSRLTGTVPEKRASTQYYLRLDKLQPQLEHYIQQRQWKPNVGPVIQNWLRQGLTSRAITRDLSWGIPVPVEGMEGKVLYVWFEAPLGYISITQLWAQAQGEPQAWQRFWKDPDTRLIHFIGKDNIVFHTLIFPAVLMAVEEGYVLPYAVPAHEFLNLEGRKISTSRRWSIDIDAYLKVAPQRVDELRFVLTALMPQTKDRDFTWEEFSIRINNELVATLTNLLHRLLSLLWRQGKVHAAQPTPLWLHRRAESARQIAERLEAYDFAGALDALMELARQANRSLNEDAPWHQPPEKAYEILLGYIDLLAAMGTLLEPFLPMRVAPTLRAYLGIPLFSWKALETPEPLVAEITLTQQPQPLVPKLTDKELHKMREALLPASSEEKTSPVQPAPSLISIEDFQKISLKVVTIREAERVPGTDKLLKVSIEAEDGLHTVVSGIAQSYTPEQLIGKQAIWVANLMPRVMRGIRSEGMLLFAGEGASTLVRVAPEHEVPPGTPVK